MDLGLLYSNFAMDNRDLTLLTSPDGSEVFQDTDGQTYCTIRPYNHADPDLARDPFSSNRRFFDSGEIELYGTMVVAGPTTDIIYVLVPDHTTCTADDIEPADLQHVIGIRLGSPENLGANLPREDLHLSLCEGSLRPTLIADRRVYWAEITPLLQRWQSVNNTPCPHCHRLIRVNMSRHMRANHTDNQCYWRCPVSTCHMWFVSELNGKDHLERIHGFREGQGCSFYECLRRFGLEWFGERSYFDQRGQSSQAMWMDMALARQSGQELINHYVITNSPASAPIRRFFHASIKHLTARYQHIAAEQALQDIKPSIGDQLNHNSGAVDSIKKEIDPPVNEASGYTATAGDGDVFSPVVVTPRRSLTRLQSRESPVVGLPRRSSTVDMSVDSPVVDTPRRSYNQHNRALAVMEASAMEPPHFSVPIARGAVNFTSIASTDLQTFIDPLPLDNLICYGASTVQSWPARDRDQILAVAGRDIAVARHNLAELTRYVDVHAAHLATCTRSDDDNIPLMAAETFPRLQGGIGSSLQEWRK